MSLHLPALLQVALPTASLLRLQALLGIGVIVGAGWLLSKDRRSVSWRVVLWGLGLQFAFAWIVLRTPLGVAFFQSVSTVVGAVLGYAAEGGRFVFGNLVSDYIPVGQGDPGNGAFVATPGSMAHTGAFFAFRVLPNIIFVSCLMTVLYHLGVMQRVVKAVAWIMQRTLRTSGAETLDAASNIFVGLMESPLVVKPFVERMTQSELMAIMTAGMATISGGVLAAYAGMMLPYDPDAAGHLIAASVMSAPAAFVLAKLLVPETGTPVTAGSLDGASVERPDVNVIDAAARGAAEGLRLALMVGAMLVAFLALISLLNGGLGWIGHLVGIQGLSLEGMLGKALVPVAWLLGIPWSDAHLVGQLIGLEFVLNEFVAFARLESILSAGSALEPRSLVITIYALTSFANFGSVAMTIAGLGEMAPSRRHDLARLGLRAMLAGLLATLLTAAVAGLLV
ncbi:MAG TPA: nucleoside transporter C-terminal domain-containing protein [Longimicrobiales bacterium]|nr:nucleoside transporter C-terminal domain-containing protein [Longimicrobiales bacterium]